jgi:hypothetical protein
MRRLILAAILAIAMPASGAEESAPKAEPTAAASSEATRTESPETARAAPSEVRRAEAAPLAEPERGAPAPAPDRPPLSADAVARGTFATAIEAREPVDSIRSLENDRDRVYYFSELVGIPGRAVTHRWAYEGETVAEVTIAVGGPRWRAYSSKQLAPSQLGEWTVSVVDESGNVLREDSFVYEAPAAAPEVATAPAAADPGAETPAEPTATETPDTAPASPAPPQP